MGLVKRRIEVEFKVDGTKVNGQSVSSSERSEVRQKCFIIVQRNVVDADTGETTTTEKTVFSEGLYNKLLWLEIVKSVQEEGDKVLKDKSILESIFDWNELFALKVIKKFNESVAEIRAEELKNSTSGATGTLPRDEQPAKSAEKIN